MYMRYSKGKQYKEYLCMHKLPYRFNIPDNFDTIIADNFLVGANIRINN